MQFSSVEIANPRPLPLLKADPSVKVVFEAQKEGSLRVT
jgi:hypothetical protein